LGVAIVPPVQVCLEEREQSDGGQDNSGDIHFSSSFAFQQLHLSTAVRGRLESEVASETMYAQFSSCGASAII
jgi:hypothetical protein